MSTPQMPGRRQPDPPASPSGKPEGLWSRIGILGQIFTALIGLAAALVPVMVATDVVGPGQNHSNVLPAVVSTPPNPSSAPPSRTPEPSQEPTQTPTQTPKPSPTPTPPPSSPAEWIDLTISDQLTDGAEEETVVVTLEGSRVATLHASREEPVVSERVEASRPGNYDYVLDAEIAWYDEAGELQFTRASGRGSIYIDDGTRLDVYVHVESSGISLSLQSATES
jgi:hypothetical protein